MNILMGLVIIFGLIPSVLIGTIGALGFAVVWSAYSHFLVGCSCFMLFICFSAIVRATFGQMVVGVIKNIETNEMEKVDGE